MNIVHAAEYIASCIAHSKKSFLLCGMLVSCSFTYVFDMVFKVINEQDTVMPLTALVVLVFIINVFVVIDLVTGVVSSKRKGSFITSKQWGLSVTKSFGSFLYLVLSTFILLIVPGNYVTHTLVFGPPILTMLKEYISIGENLEVIYGKKSYMFTLVDRLFELLELRFFKAVEKKTKVEEE